ncbi:DUF6973 domain-containing protein [Paracoccus sp. (in: a-proteobacteria)]|uniref:DUF6973 domain-containing protein n=1 Tax=Paracoccus sp. TaxID=267 RepID=UPI003A8AF0DF
MQIDSNAAAKRADLQNVSKSVDDLIKNSPKKTPPGANPINDIANPLNEIVEKYFPQDKGKEPKFPRRDPNELIKEYQVRDDKKIDVDNLSVPYGEKLPLDKLKETLGSMLEGEVKLLGQLALTPPGGPKNLDQFMSDSKVAGQTAHKFYPPEDSEGNPVHGVGDGHNDAFRHAYWNALMTKNFGEEFAAAYGTTHEGIPGNPADSETMDLYNNEVGRRIATENPDASDEELAQLIYEAVENGEMLVIDGNGELAYSDQVPVGSTGDADDPPAHSDKAPPKYTPYW